MARVALCLSGNFFNRFSEDAGYLGFEHLKSQVLDRHSTDVFLFTRDVRNEARIRQVWAPWLACSVFEDPRKFEEAFHESSLAHSNLTGPDTSRTVFGSASFFYQRDRALELCIEHADAEQVDYDFILLARLDAGQIDKHNGRQGFRVSEVPGTLSNFRGHIGLAAWDQFNEGLPDQWLVFGMEDAKAWRGSYRRMEASLRPGSKFMQWASSGITDSNLRDEFSNEVFKISEKKCDSVRPLSRVLDNHLLLKFDLIETELYGRIRPGFDSNGIVQLIYTHDTYFDALWVTLECQIRHLGTFQKTYIAANRIPSSDELPEVARELELIWLVYDEGKAYSDRLAQVVEEVSEEIVFFAHEDMPLMSTPRTDYLFEAKDLLIAKQNLACARLIRVALLRWPLSAYRVGFRAFSKIPRFSKWQVTVQPTIWKRSSFVRFLEEVKGLSVWEFETASANAMRRTKLRALQPKFSGVRRGRHHRDSAVYPYVATAIVKGKWNFSEYPELGKILESNGLDPLVRGIG